jgi:asparagine synthase (glutamine-hydrolysing)
MCGILGQVNQNAPILRDCFENMLNTLRKRGPDGCGIEIFNNGHTALGHTRLSIIDLSVAGKQPMSNEDGTIWLTFNGEIYNFQVLRRKLECLGHFFKSNTDSESIIHAYEEWGPSCVNWFRGIFAFGIYDCRDRSIFIARDHIGVKPLYYYRDSEKFVFASQPRAILESETFIRAIDHDGLSLYLAYGNVPSGQSIYKDVKKLLPGHWLMLKDGQVTVKKYWTLCYDPIIREIPDAASVIREKIEESVRSQSISDVPIGALLSGGLDSTIITYLLASNSDQPLSTFTIGFDEMESDERRFAQLVADEFASKHNERLLTYSSACFLLPDILEAYDEPFHLNGVFPFYALSRLVQDGNIKVVLGGDGGDELFAGYLWYERFLKAQNSQLIGARLARIVSVFTKILSSRSTNAIQTFFRYNGFLGPELQKRFVGKAMADVNFSFIYQPLLEHWHSELPAVLAAQLLDFNCFLVDHCLTKVDRASMACGVEVRVPFLDIELVKLVFSIDHNIIFNGNQRKALLRKAMGHLFPDKMDTNRKKGFSSPLEKWLRKGFASAGESLLLNGYLCSYHYLSPDIVRESYSLLRSSDQLLLISAELWFRRWIANDQRCADDFVEHVLKSSSNENSSVSL